MSCYTSQLNSLINSPGIFKLAGTADGGELEGVSEGEEGRGGGRYG